MKKKIKFFTLNDIMIKQLPVGILSTNCYLYSPAGKECIIIDPGGSEQEIIRTLDALALVPRGIALTHGHPDHMAAAGPLIAYYKRQAGIKLELAIHKQDDIYLGTKSRQIHQELMDSVGLPASAIGFDLDLLPDADFFFEEGDAVFGTPLRVLTTPGHTAGGVCFYSETEKILFSGDTLFYQGIGRSDTLGGDYDQLIDSLKTKLLTLPPETKVYPGHGPATSIGFEQKNNPFISD